MLFLPKEILKDEKDFFLLVSNQNEHFHYAFSMRSFHITENGFEYGHHFEVLVSTFLFYSQT